MKNEKEEGRVRLEIVRSNVFVLTGFNQTGASLSFNTTITMFFQESLSVYFYFSS